MRSHLIALALSAVSLASLAGILLADSSAREARLIGRCDGVLMAGMEESDFPAGCAWIDPIRESN